MFSLRKWCSVLGNSLPALTVFQETIAIPVSPELSTIHGLRFWLRCEAWFPSAAVILNTWQPAAWQSSILSAILLILLPGHWDTLNVPMSYMSQRHTCMCQWHTSTSLQYPAFDSSAISHTAISHSPISRLFTALCSKWCKTRVSGIES